MKTALFSLALPASTPLPSREYPNYFPRVPQFLPASTPRPSRQYPGNFPRVPQCLFPASTPERTMPLFPRVPQICVGRSAAFIGPPIHQQPENHGAIQAGSRVARISSAAHRCLHDDERLALSRRIASSLNVAISRSLCACPRAFLSSRAAQEIDARKGKRVGILKANMTPEYAPPLAAREPVIGESRGLPSG